MKQIRLALDWTPNINHIGFLIAREQGYYEDAGLDVVLLNPAMDAYTKTPAKKLETGEADLAIGPMESVISLNTKKNPFPAQAIYAILQEDISSIAVLASSGIDRPAQLDGKLYASYKARYEDEIVRQLIRNDGGSGDLAICYPDKLGIWNTLLQGKSDATWIFDNWEGVEASTQGIALRTFRMKDFGIPYGYSPVVFGNREKMAAEKEIYSLFIKESKRGFLFAQEHIEESAAMLKKALSPDEQGKIDLIQSLDSFAFYFGDFGTNGLMDAHRMEAFFKWLIDHQLEHADILQLALYTNEYN